MKKCIQVIFNVMPILAMILLVVQIVMANQLASLGKRLEKLDYEIWTKQETNEDLTIQVASVSSLLSLRTRAQAVGFHEPNQSQIIPLISDPVAIHLDP